ncbi:hypothetical protein EON67_07345 [archaeon]|nr:MAG: hypothetical protein EON67_07345 [archaeon]
MCISDSSSVIFPIKFSCIALYCRVISAVMSNVFFSLLNMSPSIARMRARNSFAVRSAAMARSVRSAANTARR